MAVFRVERNNNYTVMSNYHLRDKSLSLKAKGLLSQILSLPEDWDYTLAGLAKINAEGKDAIRAAIVELEQAGYICRRQTTDKNGKFSANEYIIREYPASAAPSLEKPSSDLPLSENPTTVSPMTGFTATENPTQLNKDSRNKEKQNKDLPSKESIPFSSELPAASSSAAAQPPESKGSDAKKRSTVRVQEMDAYRELIRENINYDAYVQGHPWDVGQLDEMIELMVEAVCSRRKTIRVAGNDFPQAVVKSRLLKLDGEHISFVFDCLRENTSKVRNMKQYLLAVLYNAPATMENHYAAQVNHDLYGNEMKSGAAQ